jgi:hypothetical protein
MILVAHAHCAVFSVVVLLQQLVKQGASPKMAIA